MGRAQGRSASAAALQCLYTCRTCQYPNVSAHRHPTKQPAKCAWQTAGPAGPASPALLQRPRPRTREARLRPFALQGTPAASRARHGRVPRRTAAHLRVGCCARRVICPSARAHQQEEPRTLQVRQARPMVQHRLLFTQATLSPFAHVIAVSEWDSYRAVKPRSGRGRSLRQTSSPSSATLHGAGPPAVL